MVAPVFENVTRPILAGPVRLPALHSMYMILVLWPIWTSLTRYFLNLCPELVIRQRPGMVHRYFPCAIEQDQGRRGRGAVSVEVRLADWNGHVEESGIKAVPHG